MFFRTFHSIEKYALPCLSVTYYPNTCFQKALILKKKCLSISWSERLNQRPNTTSMSANELLLPHCPLPPLDNAHLADFWLHSEGFLLLLSVESLCTLSSYDFWLESNSKTLQDVLNTDAWAKGSHCVLKVCIFRCKKGM